MPLEGRISVDVGFTDTDSSGGAQSLKRISLVDSSSYTTGKVAVVTGTVTTAAVTLWNQGDNGLQFGGYKDASGASVSLSVVSRIALKGSGSGVKVEDTDLGMVKLLSVGDQVSVGNHDAGAALQISALAGTASFTAVLYGS